MLWQTRSSLTGAAAALLACSLLSAQTPDLDRRPRTASVSGRVSVGGKYLANVTVTVTEAQPEIREARVFSVGGREFVDRHVYAAVTDAEGRYFVSELPAGIYTVAPKAPAYAPESVSLGLDASLKVTVDEGEAREKIDFALVRGGVITGRVTDEAGRAQVGRSVRLLELVGQDPPREVSGIHGRSLGTDDRGVYRFFGLRRGRYVVKAGGERDVLRGAVTGKKTQETYHPDVVNPAEAAVIEVAEGGEVTGVDIRLRDPAKTKTFAASGRVVDAQTGKPLPQAWVECFFAENPESESGNGVDVVVTGTDGEFTLAGLKPGRYKARLSRPQEGSPHYSEGRYFEVSDGDVSGVEVLAKRGATISGMVIAEEGRDASTQAQLAQLNLNVQVGKEYFVSGVRHGSMVGWLNTKVGADGSFQLIGAPPGKATLRINTPSSGQLHLLRLERGGAEVGDGFEIGPGEEIGGLRVIVGQGNGVIRGTLKIVGGTLPEGVTMSAQADREGPHPIGRASEVDDRGRFVIRGLLTGEYRLFFSWGMKYISPSGLMREMPRPPTGRVRVTNGAESEVTLVYDLSGKEPEKR